MLLFQTQNYFKSDKTFIALALVTQQCFSISQGQDWSPEDSNYQPAIKATLNCHFGEETSLEVRNSPLGWETMGKEF